MTGVDAPGEGVGVCRPLWGADRRGQFGADHLPRQGLGLGQEDEAHADLGLF